MADVIRMKRAMSSFTLSAEVVGPMWPSASKRCTTARRVGREARAVGEERSKVRHDSRHLLGDPIPL